jgi:hypothetical protein
MKKINHHVFYLYILIIGHANYWHVAFISIGHIIHLKNTFGHIILSI